MACSCLLSFSNQCLSCLSCWLALCAAVCTVNDTHGGKGKSNMIPRLPRSASLESELKISLPLYLLRFHTLWMKVFPNALNLLVTDALNIYLLCWMHQWCCTSILNWGLRNGSRVMLSIFSRYLPLPSPLSPSCVSASQFVPRLSVCLSCLSFALLYIILNIRIWGCFFFGCFLLGLVRSMLSCLGSNCDV